MGGEDQGDGEAGEVYVSDNFMIMENRLAISQHLLKKPQMIK